MSGNIRGATVLVLLGIILGLAGCGTMANGRVWGQDATLTPGWERIGQAAWHAAIAPRTWVPAAGAAAFRIGDADRNATEWAAKKAPIFGSRHRADRTSYTLRDIAGAAWVASAIAAPGGDDAAGWVRNKAQGLGIQTGGGILMREAVGVLKVGVNRARPDGTDRASFPSNHATGTAFYAALAARNIETFGWSPGAVTASQIGLDTLTAATAWARLEAYQHFPSDVLAGISLGNFLGNFFTEAFLGLNAPGDPALMFAPSQKGAIALLLFPF